MNKLDFTSYEIAIELDQLGFDRERFGLGLWINSGTQVVENTHVHRRGIKPDAYVVAPLWQQAVEWILDKYNIYGAISIWIGDKIYWKYEILYLRYTYDVRTRAYVTNIKTYSEALEQSILKSIELIKQNNL